MRQAERRARTIGALLDAAEASFARYGYEGTSLDAVASAAGCSKGAVYAHFTSKLEVLQAVMERVFERAGQRLERVAAELAAGHDPATAAHACFGQEDDAIHVGVMAETWQVAVLDPGIREQLEAFRESRLVLLGHAAISAGMGPVAAMQTADMTARLIDGFTLEHRLKRAESA
ncbi:MAG: TetR/AcrR family transcriptional regulator, partial [Dehalococcoidia bacterium]|nr:MAG: TetR/AcrR family transcriptional regulator [bacterium]MCE7928831.1 TetR/AcrR family transcriptional regulator [Chloroflexi bacterium CFX7]MCL4230037.1 TetR/AcrR family transcriptional regulator [Dehalococcoidia bacterium]NUQ55720.1 TetR/AcrR family transcriptional regulator [Dehalococcoidia bacterium]